MTEKIRHLNIKPFLSSSEAMRRAVDRFASSGEWQALSFLAIKSSGENGRYAVDKAAEVGKWWVVIVTAEDAEDTEILKLGDME